MVRLVRPEVAISSLMYSPAFLRASLLDGRRSACPSHVALDCCGVLVLRLPRALPLVETRLIGLLNEGGLARSDVEEPLRRLTPSLLQNRVCFIADHVEQLVLVGRLVVTVDDDVLVPRVERRTEGESRRHDFRVWISLGLGDLGDLTLPFRDQREFHAVRFGKA